MFRTAWNLDLDSLLPNTKSEYESVILDIDPINAETIEDSILNRGAFKNVFEEIRLRLVDGDFRPGCKVRIGVIATRTPALVTEVNAVPESFKIEHERFAFPIIFEVPKDGGEPFFRNDYSLNGINGLDGYVVAHLIGVDKKIPVDHVFRLALASSAFPFMFEPVNMHYCIKTEPYIVAIDADANFNWCPESYLLQKAQFVDGGFYDNVPLGLAVDIRESDKSNARKINNYVLIDPNNVGEILKKNGIEEPVEDVPVTAGLDENVMVALKILSRGLRKQVLNQALVEEFDGNTKNRLLVAQRDLPIVGSYLGNFAAFLDSNFRAIDYTSGVYDGISNIQRYFCSEHYAVSLTKINPCAEGFDDLFVNLTMNVFGNKAAIDTCRTHKSICLLFMELVKKHQSKKAISVLSKRIFGNEAVSISQTEEVLLKAVDSSVPKFTEFLAEIRRNASKDNTGERKFLLLLTNNISMLDLSPTLRYMVSEPDTWFAPITSRLFRRIQHLDKATPSNSATIAKAIRYWLPTTHFDFSDEEMLPKLVPNFIGVDAGSTGAVASWTFYGRGFTNSWKKGLRGVSACDLPDVK